MEYYSATKNEQATIWMNLKMITLREKSQAQMHTHLDFHLYKILEMKLYNDKKTQQ
jgi:hypothetical protein